MIGSICSEQLNIKISKLPFKKVKCKAANFQQQCVCIKLMPVKLVMLCILLNDFSFIYPVHEGVISFGVTTSGGSSIQSGARVPFEKVVSNAGGRYDSQLHEFVCPTTGMYQFSLGVLSSESTSDLATMMNGNILVGTLCVV